MNKKKTIVVFGIFIIIIGIVIGMLFFTGLGQEIRQYIFYKISVPKELVEVGKIEKAKIIYTYEFSEESFEIELVNQSLMNMIEESIQNKKLNNYSSQIGLAILGNYKVNLPNNISFKFDYEDNEGFVKMVANGKEFLTKINPKILSEIVQIVDMKLTQNIEMYKTDKIVINKIEGCLVEQTKIEEKTVIEYILNACKNVYTKEINYEPSIVTPNYEIDFNNNIKLLIYKKNEKGWLLKNGILSEAYGLNIFDTITENSFNNIEEKKKMFETNKITIVSPNKTIEITEKEKVEKIVANLIYGSITEVEWLKNCNIEDEYNTGIKIKINENEFVIPGIKIVGNRYIITKEKELKLCYPLQNFEKYVEELLNF